VKPADLEGHSSVHGLGRELITILQEMDGAARRLSEILRVERASMSSLDLNSLESAAQRKVGLLQALQALEARRKALVTDLSRYFGLTADVTVDELARHMEKSQGELLIRQAALLKDAVRDVQRENAVVAALAEHSLLFLHEAFMVAHRAMMPAHSVYSSSGSTAAALEGGLLRQRG